MNEKVVLITGGSAGIGRAAALLFARAGANVVLAARGAERGQKVEQEINATGPKAQFVQADVSESKQVRRLVGQVVERFGRLDCAFNNAAILNKAARTGDYEETDFDLEVSSNLKSIWLCMKYELEQMQSQQPPGGAIVNTSSVNGLGGAANAALYAMSKAGVLATHKVCCSGVCRTWHPGQCFGSWWVRYGDAANCCESRRERRSGQSTRSIQRIRSESSGGPLADRRRQPKLSCGSVVKRHRMLPGSP